MVAKFTCKPHNLNDLSTVSVGREPYKVLAAIDLDQREWDAFTGHLEVPQSFLRAFSEKAELLNWYRKYPRPCLLVRLENKRGHALLVDTQGYDYARYVAVLPGTSFEGRVKRK